MSDDKKIVINCPLCSKKELHVSTAKNGLQQCISCGYSTNEDFCISDVKFENEKFKTLDEFMKKYSVEENGYIWIPSVMQLPIGIYYPSEKDDKLIWFFAPLVDIPEEDQKNYPNPNGGFFEKRYNMEKQLEFAEFGDGLVEINMVMGIIEKNKKIEKDEEPTKNKS